MRLKETPPLDTLVPVHVCRTLIDAGEEGQHLFFLRETHGDVLFPIAAGFCEVAAIQQLLDERAGGALPPRPLTHELLVSAIESLRGRVERVIITRLEKMTFFASIVIRGGDREFLLDARPSDAVSVALAAGVPLYVTRDLLETISGEP
jgi:bifunctional DNase/RNase